MAEVTINGKTVQVRTSFKGRQWYSLPADYRAAIDGASKGDYIVTIPLLRRVIEAWQFEGDPTDEAAYEGLEVFAELRPLVGAVIGTISEAAFPKT